jgi:hypothetical protein
VKRQFAVHHDGATPDGRFCTAIHAFPPINRAQPTQSLRRALSAHKPVLLSHFFHVVNACQLIWKLFKEVFCCHNHHIFSKPQAPLRNLFMFYIQTDIHLDLLIPNMGAAKEGSWIMTLTLNARMLKKMIAKLNPKTVIPVYYGTFEHYKEPLEKIMNIKEDRIKFVKIGESITVN